MFGKRHVLIVNSSVGLGERTALFASDCGEKNGLREICDFAQDVRSSSSKPNTEAAVIVTTAKTTKNPIHQTSTLRIVR